MKKINRISKILSIGFSTSEALAAHVVLYRALNIDRELALLCMEELSKRRKFGYDFDYESFIEDELEKIPKMRNINLPEIGKKIMNNSFKIKTG